MTTRKKAAPSRPRPAPYSKPAQRWHVDKTISIGTILAMLVAVAGVGGPILVWGRAMESRVVALEVVNTQVARSADARDAETRDQRARYEVAIDNVTKQLTAVQVKMAELVARVEILTASRK